MRKKALLLIGLSILIVFGIGIITGVLILNVPNETEIPDEPEPKFYIAIDDMYMCERSSLNYFKGNLSSLLTGLSGTDTANPDLYEIFIRFNLTDRPQNWSKVEILLYKYQFIKQIYAPTIWVDLFEGNWTECLLSWEEQQEQEYYNNVWLKNEIYWEEINRFGTGFSEFLGYEVGFQRFDITDYIKDNKTISLHISCRRGSYNKGLIWLYSREWNGGEPYLPFVLYDNDTYKNYLPQLIWS